MMSDGARIVAASYWTPTPAAPLTSVILAVADPKSSFSSYFIPFSLTHSKTFHWLIPHRLQRLLNLLRRRIVDQAIIPYSL